MIDLAHFIRHEKPKHVWVAYRKCGCVRGSALDEKQAYTWQREDLVVMKLLTDVANIELNDAPWGACQHQTDKEVQANKQAYKLVKP